MNKLWLKAWLFMICIIMVSAPCFADGTTKKVLIDSVNIKTNELSTYFNITDPSSGTVIGDMSQDSVSAMLGEHTLLLKKFEKFKESGEAVDYLLMADVSKSINVKQKDNIKLVLNTIMDKVGPNDRVALMSFGTAANVVQDFTTDKEAVHSKINGLEANEENTNLYRAITQGIDLLTAKGENIPAKRVMVLVSDGEEAYDGGITKDEVLSKIINSRIPIYTVGLYSRVSTSKNIEYTKILGSFARYSTGQDFVLGMNNQNEEDISMAIKDKVEKSFIARFDTSSVKADGQQYFLNLKIKIDDNTISDGLNIRFLANDNPAQPTPTPVPKKDVMFYLKNPYYAVPAGAILVILIVLVIVLRGKKKKVQQDYVLVSEEDGHTELKENEEIKPFIVSEGDKDMEKTGFVQPAMGMQNPIQKTMPLNEQMSSPIASKRGVKIRLVKLGKNEADKVTEAVIQDSLILGRDPAKSKLIFGQDEMLSGRHCEFTVVAGKVFVSDLNSTNGTFVNGVPIHGVYKLENDDVLLVGSMEVRVNFDI